MEEAEGKTFQNYSLNNSSPVFIHYFPGECFSLFLISIISFLSLYERISSLSQTHLIVIRLVSLLNCLVKQTSLLRVSWHHKLNYTSIHLLPLSFFSLFFLPLFSLLIELNSISLPLFHLIPSEFLSLYPSLNFSLPVSEFLPHSDFLFLFFLPDVNNSHHRNKRKRFLVSNSVHPQTRQIVLTRAQPLDIQVQFFHGKYPLSLSLSLSLFLCFFLSFSLFLR